MDILIIFKMIILSHKFLESKSNFKNSKSDYLFEYRNLNNIL